MANPTELQDNRDIWEKGNITEKLTLDVMETTERSSEKRRERFSSLPKENKDGFFHTGKVGEKGDSPHEIHKRESPHCGHLPFNQSISQEPEDSFRSSGSSLDGEFDDDLSMDGDISMPENALEQGHLPKKSSQTEDNQLKKENEQLKVRVMCQICGVYQKDALFMPCAHLVYCERCFFEQRIRICPKDGQKILGGIKIKKDN